MISPEHVNSLLEQLTENKPFDSQMKVVTDLLDLIKSGPLETMIGKTNAGLPVTMIAFGENPLEDRVIKAIFEFGSLSQFGTNEEDNRAVYSIPRRNRVLSCQRGGIHKPLAIVYPIENMRRCPSSTQDC